MLSVEHDAWQETRRKCLPWCNKESLFPLWLLPYNTNGRIIKHIIPMQY